MASNPQPFLLWLLVLLPARREGTVSNTFLHQTSRKRSRHRIRLIPPADPEQFPTDSRMPISIQTAAYGSFPLVKNECALFPPLIWNFAIVLAGLICRASRYAHKNLSTRCGLPLQRHVCVTMNLPRMFARVPVHRLAGPILTASIPSRYALYSIWGKVSIAPNATD